MAAQLPFTRVVLLGATTQFCLPSSRYRLTTFWEQRAAQQAVQATISATAKENSWFIHFVCPGDTLPRNADHRRPLAAQAMAFKQMIGKFLFYFKELLQFPVEIGVGRQQWFSARSENHEILCLSLCLGRKWLQNALLCFESRMFGVLSPFIAPLL